MVCCELRGSSSKSMGIHMVYESMHKKPLREGWRGETWGSAAYKNSAYFGYLVQKDQCQKKCVHMYIERERELDRERERVRQSLRNQKCQQA